MYRDILDPFSGRLKILIILVLQQYPGSNHQPTSALLPSMGEESFVGAFLMKVYIANISALAAFAWHSLGKFFGV